MKLAENHNFSPLHSHSFSAFTLLSLTIMFSVDYLLQWTGSSLIQKVSEADNKLGVGKTFHGLNPEAVNNPDLYATEKELYLGALCQVEDNPKPWQFWMVMLKNGNYDTRSGLCPENGKPAQPFNPGRFPCFGKGCMNQPILCHQPTQLLEDGTMRGSFNGTYDLGADIGAGLDGISFYQVVWEKKVGVGSWVFRHKLKTSKKYPWLMLYLRADATKGYSGGYHYDTRGMLQTVRIFTSESLFYFIFSFTQLATEFETPLHLKFFTLYL